MKKILWITMTVLGLAAVTHGALIGQWTFEDGSLEDSTGNWNDVTLGSGASVSDGRLVLNGVDKQGVAQAKGWTGGASGFVNKTMISWVSLSSLGAGQRGGSAMSLMEDTSVGNWGGDFDSINFGERAVDQWESGSDNYNRTPFGNGGAIETTTDTLIQMAIVYDTDSITIFRDGLLYASYTEDLVTFDLGANSAVTFGARLIADVEGAAGSLESLERPV